jgi:hypothetical protein
MLHEYIGSQGSPKVPVSLNPSATPHAYDADTLASVAKAATATRARLRAPGALPSVPAMVSRFTRESGIRESG